MKSIASTTPTTGQIDEICRTAEAMAKSAMKTAVEQLINEGELDAGGVQRVIGKGDRLKAKVVAAYKTAVKELSAMVTNCLKLISGGKKIAIKATSGKKLISDAKSVFPGWIDPDFEGYGCHVIGEARPETAVEVFEMTANADFRTMFGSFDTELDELALTQEQIIEFAKEHADWLHPQGWATFSLFKVGEGEEKKFFVARVHRIEGKLKAGVSHFESGHVWNAEYRHRVVVPQLKLRP